jgi:hypothetical protein
MSELDERLDIARRAWPSVMGEDDLVAATRTGLEIAAGKLTGASDQIRLTLWNRYFRHLYAKKASYQFQDFEIVDYRLCAYGKLGLLRGPKLGAGAIESGNYICLIGAAQFFGRLVPDSLQERIARHFGVPVLNLSFGGAGPQSFLNENVAPLLRSARLVVVQAMSGRSIGCDEYPGGMNTYRKDTGERVNREVLLQEMARRDPAEFVRLVEKWLALYVAAYAQIGAQTEGRSILMWMSRRRPRGWSIETGLAKAALGTYPQMVTAETLDAIKPHFTGYVECREPNAQFDFASRFDGRPCPFVALEGTPKWSTGYYPSPEAHRLAFELLEPAIETMMGA